jgi:hypothetical protein
MIENVGNLNRIFCSPCTLMPKPFSGKCQLRFSRRFEPSRPAIALPKAGVTMGASAEARATVGEISDRLRQVFGVYREASFLP